jgi:hypothetical protein
MAVDNAASTLGRAPRAGKKYFTLAEARRSLPYLTRVLTDLVRTYGQVVAVRAQMERNGSDSKEHLEAEYERAMDDLGHLVEELNQVGVELKDFEKGLIDFPAIFEDREIYLCWKLGETSIDHWHEIDAGFAGRQDVAKIAGV